jgi:hypothetical protein
VTELAKKRGVSTGTDRAGVDAPKPFVTSPIVGATKPQHLEDAVAALSLKLSPEEIKATHPLEQPYIPHPAALPLLRGWAVEAHNSRWGCGCFFLSSRSNRRCNGSAHLNNQVKSRIISGVFHDQCE